MTQTQTQTPSVSWGARALRRTAWTLGSAVVLAALGPAIANAAGAHMRNPVSIALNALGSADDPQDCAGEPTPEPTVVPTETPSVEPTAVPTESVSVEPTVVPTPCVEPSESPSVEPTESEAPESAAPESETPESEAPDGHGLVVSTVAHCAPKGHDPLLADGANHGTFVRAAAHGESVETPWGTFDLSSQAGADAFCAAIDAARAAVPPAPAKVHGKQHEKPAKTHGTKSRHAE
jgi:hypothetical protein